MYRDSYAFILHVQKTFQNIAVYKCNSEPNWSGYAQWIVSLESGFGFRATVRNDDTEVSRLK